MTTAIKQPMKSKRGGWRPGSGRKPGTTILPDTVEKIQTTSTTFRRTENSTTRGIVEALKGVSTSPLPRWLAVMYAVPGVEEIAIEKTVRNKRPEVAKIKPGEIDPEKAVEHFVQYWREGEFHLRILHDGDYVGTMRTILVGGAESVEQERTRGQRASIEDAKADLAEVAQTMALQAQLMTLKQATTGGGEADEMKPEQLLTLAAAFKPDITPITTMMMENQRRADEDRRREQERADRAEQRNHEFQMKMLEQANAAKKDETSTGLAALTALLPHAQGLLDNPIIKGIVGKLFSRAPEPPGGWTPGAIVDILNTVGSAFGPVLQPLLAGLATKMMQQQEGAAPTAPSPHTPALPAPTMPAPNGGAPAMPNPITDVLIEELRKAPDDRNPEQLSRFLATVFVTPGVTLLGLFEELSDMEERYAKASIMGQPGLFDPRLADAQTWPGVVAFFAFIREEAAKAEEEAKRAGDA